MRTQKEMVRLRKRSISGGQQSLYLDIYIDGKRSYEYLHLYLLPETSKQNKEKNRETMQLAEAVKSKRLVAIQNGTFGFENNNLVKTPVLEYFRDMCNVKKIKASHSTYICYRTTLTRLEEYCDEKTTFESVNADWVLGFKDYLDRAEKLYINDDSAKKEYLAENSKQSYFSKLIACLHQAYKDNILKTDITINVRNFKSDETERVFLTPDEVRLMVNAECDSLVLKRAYLFSCMTGLRKSDIKALRWEQVSIVGDFTRITFKQKKTNGLMYQDINPQALEFMGEKKLSGKVFEGFIDNTNTTILLQRWALRAGITKPITYHSSRHTFVLMLLDSGVDFYTVSKLVGHSDIKTTLKYSHILDSKKRQAVLSLPDINNTTDKK